jgi:hypothetical protein
LVHDLHSSQMFKMWNIIYGRTKEGIWIMAHDINYILAHNPPQGVPELTKAESNLNMYSIGKSKYERYE